VPTIAVRAEDRLSDLAMARRTRTFERMTDAVMAAEVAGRLSGASILRSAFGLRTAFSANAPGIAAP
jgi:hypothetical protein